MGLSLVPLGDRVVIKQSPKATQSKGGVILPETVGEDHTEGTILAMGPDISYPARYDEDNLPPISWEPQIAVGDKVLFTKYAGSEIKIDGETFVIIREKDIMAIYRDDPAEASPAPAAAVAG